MVITKISAYHEQLLREAAISNSRMKYLNISLQSLRGHHHVALNNIITSYEVKKCRIHLKMLSGDYLTYSMKASHSGGSSHCRICKSKENIVLAKQLNISWHLVVHMMKSGKGYSLNMNQYWKIVNWDVHCMIFKKIMKNYVNFCWIQQVWI